MRGFYVKDPRTPTHTLGAGRLGTGGGRRWLPGVGTMPAGFCGL